MYHPRLYGSFYEMGLKYGALLRKNGAKLPPLSPEKASFGTRCYQELKAFYPELIAEVQGFAKGLGIDESTLGAFVAGLGVFEDSSKCSVFAFANNDAVIFGRNYDMLFRFKKLTESSLIAPENKYAYISQSDLFIGRSDGINEKGLAVAMSFVNTGGIRPGITFHFIIRKVLENCATVYEGIEVIKSARFASGNNFLLADKQGNLAVVETAPQGYAVRKPENGASFIHITNQFETPQMKPFDRGGIAWSKTAERCDRLKNLLSSSSNMDLKTAKKILSDKSVCLHLKKEKFGTIWSVAANLNELHIERAESIPNPGNYKPDPRLNWWLGKKQRV